MLAAPLVLATLLLAAPIVAAYLARRRARREVVGSLRLLRAAAGHASSRRLIPRLKHPISLLLILLTLAVLAAGLAGPRCGPVPDGRLLVVLDAGAGMGRTVEGGGSMLDVARSRLGATLADAAPTQIALVVAGREPVAAAGLTGDVMLVKAAMDLVQPEGPADVGEAVRLADALCVDPGQDAILLVTDGLDDPLPETACPVRRLSLPQSAPNVGIAALQARTADALGLVEVVVSLASDHPGPVPIEVEIRLDGHLVDAVSADLEPRGQLTSVRQITGPGSEIEAIIVSDGGSDTSDDRVSITLGSVPPVKVGLVTDRPDGLLATALRLHPQASVKVVEPEASQSLTDVDLAVLEVPCRPPPVGRLVAFGDAIPSLGLQEGEPLQAPSITRWAFDDPLLRYVELDSVVLQRAWPLAVPGSGAALIEADGRPIAVRGELSGRAFVALGFGIQDSDLALRVDFLHLIANLLDWAAPPPAAQSRALLDRGADEVRGGGAPLDGVADLSAGGAQGRPWWVWAVWTAIGLLVLEAVLAFFRPWRHTTTLRKVGTYAIRGGLLLLLLASLLGLQWVLPGGAGTVVFVVDRSASVGDAGLADARTRVDALRQGLPAASGSALVLFDRQAEVAVRPGQEWSWPEALRGEPVEGTDLGGALQVALGLIDPSAGGRIVVLTDGGDTRGGLRSAAETARARRVPVDVVRLPERTGDPAMLGLDLDATVVRPGETVRGTVTVRGPATGSTARLVVQVDGEDLVEEEIELPAGRSRAVFEAALPDDVTPGARRLSARIEAAAADPEPGNNGRSVGLTIGPPPRILAVSADALEVEALARVVRAEGMELDIVSPATITVEDLRDADVLLIGDVPLQSADASEEVLSPALVQAIRPWVSEGGGLITLGGDRTYELGGWGETPLAAVLPLDLEGKAEDLEPGVTLVQILDSSASMGDWSGYQTKMALANEGAVASMRLLREQDRLAVLAVNTVVDTVVPGQAVTDPVRLSAAIRGIKPGGGGIYTYTSLIAAEAILERSDTPLKHVVLYADAQDAEEIVKGQPFGFGPGPTAFEVAQRIRQDGGSLSVIALGEPRDQHVGFLQDLARLGGGRFRITKEPGELRALFVEETREVVRTVVHDELVKVREGMVHPSLAGVDIAGAPSLLGYVEVQARDTADVVLLGPDDRPILATWQYGLGHVAAWSTDLGSRWGRRWLDWPGYPRVVVQQMRWALRPPVVRGAGVEVSAHYDGLGLTITRYDDEGLSLPDQGLRATLLDGIRPAEPVDLRVAGPGRWEGSARIEPGTVRTLVLQDASTGEEIGRQPVVAPPSMEREVTGSEGVERVVSATGGTVDAEVIGAPAPGQGRGRDLGWWMALLAVLLLPLDAWIRVPVRG